MTTRYNWWVGWGLALGLASGARAQVPRGNGLLGAYYQGGNFERYVATRRAATLDYDWHGRPPVAGVGAEQFSGRWTGWLVPPATGRYVLHLSADDGCRLWLHERLLLDDWRSQGLSYYQVALELRAGVAYALRLEYCQHTGPAQLRLAWEPPAVPAAGSGRRRTLAAQAPAGAVVIPTRYLFSEEPALPPPPPLALAPPAGPLLAPAARRAAPASVVVVQPRAEATARPRPRSYLAFATRPAAPASPAAVASRVAGLAARLATGQPLTLRTLYFEQGQATLLPAVQASLDTLAQALASRPALRLEVQGHTDNQGDPFVNQRLSQRRASAVCAYLAAHGVAAARLRAVGYGGSRPVADNKQPDQRPRNRRVVLKPLGGRGGKSI